MDGIKLNSNNFQEPATKLAAGSSKNAAKKIIPSNAVIASGKKISETEKLNLTTFEKGKNPAIAVNLSQKELPKILNNNLLKVAVSDASKKVLKAGLTGVPLDAAFNSFSYHSGEIDARQFAGQTAGGFLNWSVFEAGSLAAVAVASSVTGRKLGPLGSMVVGVGTGLVASSLYHKTAGYKVDEQLSKAIPENIARPVANTFDKYFASPVDKYILTPIKENPKTAMAVGAVIATALTIKYPVKFGLNTLVGTAGATIISLGGNLVLNNLLPEEKKSAKKEVKQGQIKDSLPGLETPVTVQELKWAVPLEENYSKDKSSVSDADVLKYMNILQRYEKMQSVK